MGSMSTTDTHERARVASVGDQERQALGRQIQDRRERHNLSPGELADIAGVSRSNVYAVEKGTARPRSQRIVSDALAAWEAERGVAEPLATDVRTDPSTGMVTFRVRGSFGVEVEVQGPVENIDELAAQVDRLMKTAAARSAAQEE